MDRFVVLPSDGAGAVLRILGGEEIISSFPCRPFPQQKGANETRMVKTEGGCDGCVRLVQARQNSKDLYHDRDSGKTRQEELKELNTERSRTGNQPLTWATAEKLIEEGYVKFQLKVILKMLKWKLED
jgi:hypothetical protein